MNPQLPIACTLSPEDLRARRGDLLPGLAERVVATERVDGGIRLQFAAEPDIVSTIAKVVEAERQCCAFLRFEISVPPAAGPVALTIIAPPEAQGVLEELIQG